MARKKFFYNRVYNAKRNIITFVVVGLCVIGIIVCFLVVSNYKNRQNNPQEVNVLNLKQEVMVEVNENLEKDAFFYDSNDIDYSLVNVEYPSNYSTNAPGRFTVTIKYNGESATSNVIVVDTTKPNLEVKDVTITEGESYSVNNFVSNCTDNSNNNCIISFYKDALDEDGNTINFAGYRAHGTYAIRVSAKDESGNEIVKNALLVIKSKTDNTPTTPVTPIKADCKYGNNEYDTSKYILAVSISANNCAISLDLYKDSMITSTINKIMETETLRIKKDTDALKLNGRFTLNRQIAAIFNNDGTGLVGYELSMNVNITSNGETKNIVSYKINTEGKRVFSSNPYNLSE